MLRTTVHAEREDNTLVLTWAKKSTRVDLSAVKEAWVVRVGDSFSGPNEQALLLVDASSFVGLSANIPGLIASLRPELVHAFTSGRLHCADTARLPRAWEMGMKVFPTTNIEPQRRPLVELESAKRNWTAVTCATFEEVFT